MTDRLVLYTGEKNVSSWSMRAFVMLVHKGLDFEERTISLVEDVDRKLRLRVSPTGRVPVLHHLMQDEERIIPDSLAILEYLEETYPPPRHPPLWPGDPGKRAHARWLAAAMHSGFTRLREGMSFNLCFLPERPKPPAGALEDAEELLGLWDDTLERRVEPSGPFLFGEFGGVDAMFAPAVVRLSAFRVPSRPGSNAPAYMQAVLEHRAVRRWMDAARALPPVARE